MSDKRVSNGSNLLWSIIVLIACLSFIYMIFFRYQKPTWVDAATENSITKQPNLVDTERNDTWPAVSAWSLMQVQIAADTQQDQDQPIQPLQEEPAQPINTNPAPVQQVWWPVVEQWKTFFSVQDLFAEAHVETDGMIPLSGTFLWEWALRSLVDFGLIWQESYVLKTVKNSHFAYLWSFASNTIPLLGQLWWNIVEITDKNSIQEHSLYWDRIRFLNTERYKDLEKVIYIVFFDQTNDAWFVQMDRDQYYASKPSTQALFDPWYDW